MFRHSSKNDLSTIEFHPSLGLAGRRRCAAAALSEALAAAGGARDEADSMGGVPHGFIAPLKRLKGYPKMDGLQGRPPLEWTLIFGSATVPSVD